MTDTAFLSASDITVGYGGNTVLDRLSLSVDRGEFVALLGSSSKGNFAASASSDAGVAGNCPIDYPRPAFTPSEGRARREQAFDHADDIRDRDGLGRNSPRSSVYSTYSERPMNNALIAGRF